MTKYLIKRILRSACSIVIVVGIVMVMIYSALDRNLIFAEDSNYQKVNGNAKEAYKAQQWEEYGYMDYIPYTDWLKAMLLDDEIDQATYALAAQFGDKCEGDNDVAAEYISKFIAAMEDDGYTINALNAQYMPKTVKYKDGGQPFLFATKDHSVFARLWNYFTGIVVVDNINYVQDDIDNRGISFTLYDPAYGGDKFAPAIMGNGTYYKYLFYTDNQFPFIHQNLVRLNLGLSYSVERGIDVWNSLTDTQGSYEMSTITYPTGLTETGADDLHSARYVSGSLEKGTAVIQARYTDDYTSTTANKAGKAKMGYSFICGIGATILAYMLAVPMGTLMALKKDKLLDKIGTFYIMFITAVPSLAYIFLFRAIGSRLFKLPTTFDMENPVWLMYVLPIISLALPSVANLMKWLRRYMIDQMNSDYVKFARSGGLSEGEIFSKHILKNAIIPITHGIPASVLGALTGAIITERVYVVPGAGNMLTRAIAAYDNGVIVGMVLFYAVLTVTSVILGDILMSIIDPRISFTEKAR